MKILNLYSGIGGNRKLWGDNHDITAIEINPDIAKIYQDFFSNDKVIITDAHQYLLEHYKEYDFIWSSPPCPTHSRFNYLNDVQNKKQRYPDMVLWQEIIFLKYWFKGLFCVENVISYYEPMFNPVKSNNHYYWLNFYIEQIFDKKRGIRGQELEFRKKLIKFNLDKFKLSKQFEKKILNNCVEPEMGKYILDQAMNIDNNEQLSLF